MSVVMQLRLRREVGFSSGRSESDGRAHVNGGQRGMAVRLMRVCWNGGDIFQERLPE
jgi:hypothetical protein